MPVIFAIQYRTVLWTDWFLTRDIAGKCTIICVHPCFKSSRNFFCNVEKLYLNQNIDLQFYELYYEVFWYEQVKFYNI